MTWFTYILAWLLTLSAVLAVSMIDKPRNSWTLGDGAVLVAVNGFFVVGLLLGWAR